jgi:pyruvate/2-oxoglutarate dehydrogenase complex dihydrolipoamide acyltransferase (E2) component
LKQEFDMATQIVMPPLGDTTDEVRLLQWYKKEGDAVAKGETLFEVETDKSNVQVDALRSGVLRKILVVDGTMTSVGTVVGWITDADEMNVPSA